MRDDFNSFEFIIQNYIYTYKLKYPPIVLIFSNTNTYIISLIYILQNNIKALVYTQLLFY